MTQQVSTLRDRRPPAARNDAKALKGQLHDIGTLCRALRLDFVMGPSGRFASARCPYADHADYKASLSIFTGRDAVVHFRCHGCGRHGDALELVAAAHGLDPATQFMRVLEIAADIAAETEVRVTSSPSPVLGDAEFHALATAVLDNAPLAVEPDVLDYLARRGLADAAVAEGWGALPGDPRRRRMLVTLICDRHGRAAWASSGLSAGVDFASPSHRILIPWRTPVGTIDILQRRTVGCHSYLGTRGREIRFPHGIERCIDSEPTTVVIVEGAVDVLAYRALHPDPRQLVLGLPGATSWRSEWTSLAIGRQVVLALDADDSGRRGDAALVLRLRQVAVGVRLHKPSVGKDWGDALARGHR